MPAAANDDTIRTVECEFDTAKHEAKLTTEIYKKNQNKSIIVGNYEIVLLV